MAHSFLEYNDLLSVGVTLNLVTDIIKSPIIAAQNFFIFFFNNIYSNIYTARYIRVNVGREERVLGARSMFRLQFLNDKFHKKIYSIFKISKFLFYFFAIVGVVLISYSHLPNLKDHSDDWFSCYYWVVLFVVWFPIFFCLFGGTVYLFLAIIKVWLEATTLLWFVKKFIPESDSSSSQDAKQEQSKQSENNSRSTPDRD